MEYSEFENFVFQDEKYQVQVDFTSTRNAAIAQVTYRDDESKEIFVGMGEAIRDRADKPNLEVAYYLSMGRAFENVGQKLLRRGNGLVKHIDDMKIDSAKRKGKAERKQYSATDFQARWGISVESYRDYYLMNCTCVQCRDYRKVVNPQ